MDLIEESIQLSMSGKSFQPTQMNNNVHPSKVTQKQQQFYSSTSTTPTDIMDVTKACLYWSLFVQKSLLSCIFKKELSLWKRRHQQKVSNQLVENHHLYSQNQKKTKTLFDFFIHSEFFVCKNYWNSYRFYCTWNSYVKLDIHHWDDQHDQKNLK